VTNNRPNLTLDLLGPDGNVFVVIGRARSLLTGLKLEHFNTEIGQATLLSEGTTYKDILSIVNKYTHLIDSSGTYAEYAIDEKAVMAAVDRLNEQLASLPEGIYCPLDGLYPEFGMPDCGPEVYLTMVENEITLVGRQIEQALAERREPLQRLLAMLQDCAYALQRAGVGSVV